jgi:hypothetical protein
MLRDLHADLEYIGPKIGQHIQTGMARPKVVISGSQRCGQCGPRSGLHDAALKDKLYVLCVPIPEPQGALDNTRGLVGTESWIVACTRPSLTADLC